MSGPGEHRRPRVLVLYQFMGPDDVVSARHFDGLCDGLAARGFDVVAAPSNRACRDARARFPRRERRGAVSIERVWRPALDQASAAGRVVNAAWMLAAWSLRALAPSSSRFDAVIVGTDPPLSVACAVAWRLVRPDARVAHWAFDLQPEASVADGLLRAGGPAHRALAAVHRAALRRCDLVADLGACMRQRLLDAGARSRQVTLTPWALAEPPSPVVPDEAARRELFGDARLGLLYSGNFGRAHSCDEVLDLARRMRDAAVAFSFAVRGNAADRLRAALRDDDVNVRLAPFAPESELERRLGAADVHVVSLRAEWTGIVVPSKFFGALAAGRPVLFAGSRESAIARWIDELGVGWLLDEASSSAVEARLRALAADPRELVALRARCHAAYAERFARERVLDAWADEMRALIDAPTSLPSRP